ncbi:MAG TPA: LacI family DNA-binding transcriptional regulator [Thermomicrobiales bacterium]|nr:LacI family DNA-binding transcriptional regulator [Thermomicrobiales bacterium]
MTQVGIRDVAERAGVSVGTVSNVLNGNRAVASSTVGRVRAAIDELGYVRNDVARQLRAGRSTTVGFVALDARNPFFADIARGAEDEASKRDLVVVVGNSDQRLDQEARYLDAFAEQRVRGILISPLGDVSSRIEQLHVRGIPAVLVDRFSPDHRVSSVSVDDVAGGRMAVAHLLESGRRRIAFVGGPEEIRQVADRLKGARSVVNAAGADLEVIPAEGLTVLHGRAAGEELAGRRPSDRPDGIFAANDLVALGLLQSLVMRGGIRVPEDLSLIGFDDIDFAASAVVPLTSIRQPSLLMGRTALQILEAEASPGVASPQQLVFDPELVIRRSTNR